jgi:hypothetical protein
MPRGPFLLKTIFSTLQTCFPDFKKFKQSMINAWLGYKSTWSGKSPTPCLVDWFVLICKLKNHLSVEIFIILIDFMYVCIRISIKKIEKKNRFQVPILP